MGNRKIKYILSNKDFSEVLTKGGISLLIRILGFLSGYLFIYLTVKYFGSETQGRLSLSFSVMIIGSLLCRLGVDVNLVKVFAINNNLENAKGIYFKLMPIFFIITILGSLVIAFFSKSISTVIFNDPGLEPYILWTSPTILFFTFVLINAGVLRGLRKNTIYSFLFNGGRFLFSLIFLLIFFIWDNQNRLTPVISHTVSIGLLFLISFYYIKKNIFPNGKANMYKSKKFIKESFPMMLSASMIVFLGWTDTVVLGIYTESSQVGIYSVAIKIAAVISFSLQALDSILAPKLSQAYHDNNIRIFKKLVIYSTMVNATVAVVATLGILLFSDFILGIFGAEFYGATTALFILCLGQLFNAFFGPVGSVFQMTGRQSVFQNILIASFILNLTLNLLLAPKHGLNGVAIATASSLIVSKILSAYYIKKLIWNA